MMSVAKEKRQCKGGEKLTTKDLFDLSHTLAKEYLEGFTYPYEALSGIKAMIAELGKTLPASEYDEVHPHVWVAKTAEVAPTAYLGEYTIVGPETEVRHCAFVRGGTDQYFRKPATRRRHDRTYEQARISKLRIKIGHERKQQHSYHRQYGSKFNRFCDIEFMRKERKDQIDHKLRAKIDEHQKPEQGIGNAIQ